jgi:hypothetical protein
MTFWSSHLILSFLQIKSARLAAAGVSTSEIWVSTLVRVGCDVGYGFSGPVVPANDILAI